MLMLERAGDHNQINSYQNLQCLKWIFTTGKKNYRELKTARNNYPSWVANAEHERLILSLIWRRRIMNMYIRRPIKARSYAAMAVAQAGGLNIRQVIPDMAALKPELPFGQVIIIFWHFIPTVDDNKIHDTVMVIKIYWQRTTTTYLNLLNFILDIQVPYLVDGDVKLAHSNAILRYVSKKSGLDGDNDKAYAMSQMFIEEV